jgi:hypothetical protein
MACGCKKKSNQVSEPKPQVVKVTENSSTQSTTDSLVNKIVSKINEMEKKTQN